MPGSTDHCPCIATVAFQRSHRGHLTGLQTREGVPEHCGRQHTDVVSQAILGREPVLFQHLQQGEGPGFREGAPVTPEAPPHTGKGPGNPGPSDLGAPAASRRCSHRKPSLGACSVGAGEAGSRGSVLLAALLTSLPSTEVTVWPDQGRALQPKCGV